MGRTKTCDCTFLAQCRSDPRYAANGSFCVRHRRAFCWRGCLPPTVAIGMRRGPEYHVSIACQLPRAKRIGPTARASGGFQATRPARQRSRVRRRDERCAQREADSIETRLALGDSLGRWTGYGAQFHGAALSCENYRYQRQKMHRRTRPDCRAVLQALCRLLDDGRACSGSPVAKTGFDAGPRKCFPAWHRNCLARSPAIRAGSAHGVR